MNLPAVESALVPVQSGGVPELDGVRSFVRLKLNKTRLWTAICRRTGQTAAFVNDCRNEGACRILRKRIPKAYRACHSFSDFYKAYAAVFP